MQLNEARLVRRLKDFHAGIRQAILERRGQVDLERLARVVESTDSDVKFDVDVAAERRAVEFCRAWAAEDKTCFVLVAEGISPEPGAPERMVFPQTATEDDAEFVVILDPCDGSRELMYDKRSAWVLSGIAQRKPEGNTLADIAIAVQTELPPAKQSLADTLVASAGSPTICERWDLPTGKMVRRFNPAPSRARTIEQGFVTVSKFFPGGKELASRIEESLAERLLGPIRKGRAAIFDDEYISTGGQFYELIAGHDRFIADIRPLMAGWLSRRGIDLGLCAHPYDVCTELVARQAGVCIVQPDGAPLNAPLDTVSNVSWVGYANETIRRQIEPHLQELLANILIPGKLPKEAGGEHQPMGIPERRD